MALSQTRSRFTQSCIPDFLRSGWVFSTAHEDLLIGWGQFQWLSDLVGDECALYAPDFYLTESKPWLLSERWAVVSRRELRQILGNSSVGLRLDWKEPSREAFAQTFSFLKEQMLSGELKKAVPVVFAEAQGELTDSQRLALLQNILEFQAPIRAYGFWTQDEAFMGVTPEVLFSQVDEQTVQTMALAGTMRLPATAEERGYFLKDPKERHEHQLVIDDIQNVLAQFGKVVTQETHLLELPYLLHLKTDLQVRLSDESKFSDLVRVLHPTPALGVSPRSLGLTWMKTWDDAALRGRFGAPFGIRHQGSAMNIADCLVAIRGVQWKNGHWRLGSGCGVVSQSELEKEWRELTLKRESVKRMLGL